MDTRDIKRDKEDRRESEALVRYDNKDPGRRHDRERSRDRDRERSDRHHTYRRDRERSDRDYRSEKYEKRDRHRSDRHDRRDNRHEGYRRRDDHGRRDYERSPKRRRTSRSPKGRNRSPSPPDPNIPDIYKYTFVSPIAEGVFGNVFLARGENNVKFAIKRLKLSSPDSYDPQYKREIDILKECDHKNIVKLKEVTKNAKNEKFLVLEYCPLEFKDVLSHVVLPSQIKNVIHQLLSGLDYIHNKNIIHRDLKPDNSTLSMLWN